MVSRTKQDVINEICDILDVRRLQVSRGSTEPKELLLVISELCSITINPRMTKPELAKAIVEHAGLRWRASCSSTGSTITLDGLLLVLQATKLFTLTS